MSIAGLFSIGTAVPTFTYSQEDIFRKAGYRSKAIQRIFAGAGISKRHMCVEPSDTVQTDPQWFSNHYCKWAILLGAQAARQALEQAGLEGPEIDYLVATSCTGYLCPGISQRLAKELGLSPRAKTANLVGMGCNAAVPALERAKEFAEQHPGQIALVVCVEISSAAYWIDDQDLESAVGTAIFSDGAAAAIVQASDENQLFSIGKPVFILEKFETYSNRESIGKMGFYNEQGRLKILLSKDIPDDVLPLIKTVIEGLLKEHRLTFPDIHHWIIHPGGRKILEYLDQELHLGNRLQASRNVLSQFGNMSSATVLFVAKEQIQSRLSERLPKQEKDADYGVVMAMGPGLTVERGLDTVH